MSLSEFTDHNLVSIGYLIWNGYLLVLFYFTIKCLNYFARKSLFIDEELNKNIIVQNDNVSTVNTSISFVSKA